MVFQITLHDHQIETIRTSLLDRRNWLTTCSSWTKTTRLTISISSGRWDYIIINIGVLYRTPRPSYWLTWEPLSESLWCWQKTKDIGVIKRTWDCIYLWPMLFPGYSYSYSYSWCFQGTGEFINTRFFCRVCALMHNTQVCTHQYDLRQLVLILIISVTWFSSSLSPHWFSLSLSWSSFEWF